MQIYEHRLSKLKEPLSTKSNWMKICFNKKEIYHSVLIHASVHHATLIKLYQKYKIACCPIIQLQNSVNLSAVAKFPVLSM